MRQAPEKNDDLDLDLPALDGDEDASRDEPALDGILHSGEDAGDAFDDSTNEDAPYDDFTTDGAEGGWLLDSETASGLDVGPLDVVVGQEAERSLVEDDHADASGLEDLVSGDETLVVDTGEEGPIALDEELREEDLPAIDADDDGDVPDDDLFDRAALASDEVRWDDRAWAKLADHPSPCDEADDSGVLAVPGEDAAQSARDKTWKRLEETGRIMAAAFLPGASLVLALATPDRSRALIVRVQTNGDARIIAEIDPRTGAAEDDGEACTVTFVRWDAANGCLFVGGNFGVEAYRPG